MSEDAPAVVPPPADGGGAAAATAADVEIPEGSENAIKIICLGDTMVGKSKLVERFLMDDFEPQQMSTFALTLFKHKTKIGDEEVTYQNLAAWYKELREYRSDIPCIVLANKIDAKIEMTQKKFRFAEKNNCPFYFVSAADGTNVVKVFTEVIKLGHHYKNNTDNFMDAVMELLAEQRLDD
eukprot:gene12257-26108_t